MGTTLGAGDWQADKVHQTEDLLSAICNRAERTLESIRGIELTKKRAAPKGSCPRLGSAELELNLTNWAARQCGEAEERQAHYQQG